jgi:flagellar biogenesis protein FliO
MLPGPSTPKFRGTLLITIGIGVLLAVASFVVVTSQWGKPTTSIATAGFFGILLGILVFVAGCIWLLVKIRRGLSAPVTLSERGGKR